MQAPVQNRILKDECIKIPKTITREVIQHKHYRAFLVYMQLKPLYVSGVILNDAGKFPYTHLAKYLGLSVSGLRGKIKQLKKHKLIRADKDKNFHLASYQSFVSLFRPQFLRRMKKYVFKNVAVADMLVKTAAIQENFRKQNYVLKRKIIQKEIYGTVNAPVDRIKQPEGFNSSHSSINDCHQGPLRTDLSKSAIRKIRKIILQDYENILHKQKVIFLDQMEQIEFGLPKINPYVTLSCIGLGRLLGKGGSSGHYQQRKLVKSNLVTVKPHIQKIQAVSAAVYENMNQVRSDVFSYQYPVKRGRISKEAKFFLRLPNLMNLNFNFIYENAKN